MILQNPSYLVNSSKPLVFLSHDNFELLSHHLKISYLIGFPCPFVTSISLVTWDVSLSLCQPLTCYSLVKCPQRSITTAQSLSVFDSPSQTALGGTSLFSTLTLMSLQPWHYSNTLGYDSLLLQILPRVLTTMLMASSPYYKLWAFFLLFPQAIVNLFSPEALLLILIHVGIISLSLRPIALKFPPTLAIAYTSPATCFSLSINLGWFFNLTCHVSSTIQLTSSFFSLISLNL